MIDLKLPTLSIACKLIEKRKDLLCFPLTIDLHDEKVL
jgi:hypothetical protein